MQNYDVLFRKFFSFGGDGVNVFQNYSTCVTIQIQVQYALVMIDVHYMAH
jgi:hypothetical protein